MSLCGWCRPKLEGLGAVARLEQEAVAVRDRGQGRLEGPGLAGEHQRRLPGQLVEDPVERGRLRPVGLLGGRERPPGAWRPGLGRGANGGVHRYIVAEDPCGMSSEVWPRRCQVPRPPGYGRRTRHGLAGCRPSRTAKRPGRAVRPTRRGRRLDRSVHRPPVGLAEAPGRRHGRPGPRSPATGPAGTARRAGRPSPGPGRNRPGWPGRPAAVPAPGPHRAG